MPRHMTCHVRAASLTRELDFCDVLIQMTVEASRCASNMVMPHVWVSHTSSHRELHLTYACICHESCVALLTYHISHPVHSRSYPVMPHDMRCHRWNRGYVSMRSRVCVFRRRRTGACNGHGHAASLKHHITSTHATSHHTTSHYTTSQHSGGCLCTITWHIRICASLTCGICNIIFSSCVCSMMNISCCALFVPYKTAASAHMKRRIRSSMLCRRRRMSL